MFVWDLTTLLFCCLFLWKVSLPELWARFRKAFLTSQNPVFCLLWVLKTMVAWFWDFLVLFPPTVWSGPSLYFVFIAPVLLSFDSSLYWFSLVWAPVQEVTWQVSYEGLWGWTVPTLSGLSYHTPVSCASFSCCSQVVLQCFPLTVCWPFGGPFRCILVIFLCFLLCRYRHSVQVLWLLVVCPYSFVFCNYLFFVNIAHFSLSSYLR